MKLLDPNGTYLGRMWDDAAGGPCILRYANGTFTDITSKTAPTVRDILEMDEPLGYVRKAQGSDVQPNGLLAPCDLQAIKACGVTFVNSMLERVIEERPHAPNRPAVSRSKHACPASRPP